MEPLYVHLAIWLIPVSKPNIQIQIETPFGKWQFHGSFSKYCELWRAHKKNDEKRHPVLDTLRETGAISHEEELLRSHQFEGRPPLHDPSSPWVFK